MEEYKVLRKYMILDENDSHEYDVVVDTTPDGRRYTLYASNNPEWTNPGSRLLSMTDDGDGMKFDKGDISDYMDYSKVAEMRVLLAVNKHDDQAVFVKYKLILKEEVWL